MQPRGIFVEQILFHDLPKDQAVIFQDIFTASFFSSPQVWTARSAGQVPDMFEMPSDQGLFPPRAAVFGKAAFTNTPGKTQIQKVKRM